MIRRISPCYDLSAVYGTIIDSQQQDDDDDQPLDEDDEEGEKGCNDNEVSAHGERSRRIKANISLQEEELLSEKPWALRGEVHSHDRPENR